MEPGLAGGVTLDHRPKFIRQRSRRCQHEARIDPVITSRQAAAGAGACSGPAGAAARRVSAAAENIQHFGDDRGGLTGVDAGWPGGRADFHTLSTASAAVEDVAYPNI